MVTKSDVIRKVGEQTYLDACASARRDAARSDYGRGMGWGEPLADIPHQVTDLIWDGDWPWRVKLRLFFDIYDDMPAYGHLMYVPHHYSHFSQADNQEWWAGVRARRPPHGRYRVSSKVTRVLENKLCHTTQPRFPK